MSAGDLTQLINRAAKGDQAAADDLWNQIYGDARVIATGRARTDGGAGQFDVSVLISEAWVRLNGSGPQEWESRRHYFGAVARAMTEYVIDTYRANHAQRRDGQIVDLSMSRIAGESSDGGEPLTLDQVEQAQAALNALEAQAPLAADVYRLSKVMRMTTSQIAFSLGVTAEDAQKHLRLANAHMKVMRGRPGDLGRAN